MPRLVSTREDDVSVPYGSLAAGMNSRQIVTAGTVITLNDDEYAALSETAIYDGVTSPNGVLNDHGPVLDAGVEGVQVAVRAPDVPPASGAAEDIFTVDGGQVQVLAFYGMVTVAIPNESIDFDLDFDADSGAPGDFDIATTVAVDQDAAGQFYSLPFISGGTLLNDASNVNLATPYTFPAGDIVLTVSGGGTIGTSARVTWVAVWRPLEDGATLAATSL